MNPTELLAAYDREQRHDLLLPDMRREVTDSVVRLISDSTRFGWVMWSKLTDINADAVIRDEFAYFRQLGYEFDWKTFAHDNPPDLAARLMAQGLNRTKSDGSVMILDMDAVGSILAQSIPPGIRRLETTDEVWGLIHMLGTVWEDDFTELGEELLASQAIRPDSISFYAAFVDGRMVSGAWVRYANNSFASLFAGTTLPDYRGRGYYSDLVAARAAEARQRGKRYLMVDAADTSRPILEKLGFVCVTTNTSYGWRLPSDQEGK